METRSKKVKFIEKVISKAEYDKMCKVRVLLQRFNADAFRKTGEFFPANKKVTNNVHVREKFLISTIATESILWMRFRMAKVYVN